MKSLRYIVFLIAALALALPMSARRDLNDKVLNRPYADQRRWHLGFSVGAFTQDLRFTHNGLITDDGRQWRVQQPDYQPGFCVNGLLSLRLNDYFSVRF
ncbi:MAG: PorT family protein, partial [Muribaculaceae bacterium]